MEYKPSPDALKKLRTARSLSQSEVAEAIGANANNVSRWERGVATPSPYYRRKLAELFEIDLQTLLAGPQDETGQTTAKLPPEPEPIEDLSSQTQVTSQGKRQAQPAWRKGISRLRKIPLYIPVATIALFMLISGSFLVFPSLIDRAPPDLFPALCSGKFQSTNANIIPIPAAEASPDGGLIGLSEGGTIFDLDRPDRQEIQDKLQAAQDWVNNPQGVVSSLENAIRSDQTDAEAQIYLENWRVLGSNHPHITLVVGVSFPSPYAGGSRDVLQGAFTAQKECDDQSQQDNNKTQIVLMIANVSQDAHGNIAGQSTTFVTNQIADQAQRDSTIVGIIGWPISGITVDVIHQLKIRKSDLLMLAACSASDELKQMSHFFRNCPADEKQAQVLANFALEKIRKASIAILYQPGSSWSESFKRALDKNIPKAQIVGEEGYRAGDQDDIQRAFIRAYDQKPHAIFFAGYPGDLAILLKVIPQPNNLLIFGGSALSITNVYISLPSGLDHVYFTAFASPNQWDKVNLKPPFFRDYKTNFGTLTAPGGLSSVDAGVLLGYDAMLTLLYSAQQVLFKQNTITPSDLEQALEKITGANAIQGVTGRIAFDSNGNQDDYKMIFAEHINGTRLIIDEQHGCLLKNNCGPQ